MDPGSSQRTSVLALLTTLVAGLTIGGAVTLSVATPGQLGLQTTSLRSGVWIISSVVPDSPAWDAGVRPGALLLTAHAPSTTDRHAVVVRWGRRIIRVLPTATVPTFVDYLAAALGGCLLGLGILVRLRSAHPTLGTAFWRLCLIASLALGLVPAGIHGIPWALILDALALKLFGPSLLDLVLLFFVSPPDGHAMSWGVPTSRARRRLWLPALLLVGVFPVCWWHPVPLYSLLNTVGASVLAGYMVASGAYVIRAPFRPQTPAQRAQCQLLAVGLLLGLTPFVVLSVIPLALRHRVLVSAEITILALGLLPVAVGTAIVRAEFLGITSMIHRRTLRIVLGVMVLGGIAAVTLGLAHIGTAIWGWSLAVSVLMTSLVAAGTAAPLHRGLTRLCERLLFRDTYDLGGVLLHLSVDLAALGPEEMGTHVVRSLTTVLDLSFALLITPTQTWCHCHPRSAVPEALLEEVTARARTAGGVPERAGGIHRMMRLPVFFLPLGPTEGTAAVLCLGPKRSGDAYTAQDQMLLGALGQQFSILLHNAQLRLQRREQIATLQALLEERKVLNERVGSAAERERRRLAGVLHDDAIQLGEEIVRSLGDLLGNTPLSVHERARLTAVALLSEDLLGRLRDVVTELYPPPLETAGLLPALRALLEDATQAAGHPCSLEIDPRLATAPLSPAFERLLYMMVREAVGNALRHAPGAAITVTVLYDEDELHIRVADDGPGFVPRSPSELAAAGHLGLTLVQERAFELGGMLQVDAAPEQGTVIDIRVPVGGRPGVEEMRA